MQQVMCHSLTQSAVHGTSMRPHPNGWYALPNFTVSSAFLVSISDGNCKRITPAAAFTNGDRTVNPLGPCLEAKRCGIHLNVRAHGIWNPLRSCTFVLLKRWTRSLFAQVILSAS